MSDDPVLPFRGLYYEPHAVLTLERVAAPASIERGAAEDYHGRSPYNVARLTHGLQGPADTVDDNRFTRARSFLLEWQKGGILVRESDPTFYLYEQEWDEGGRSHHRMALYALERLPQPSPPPAPPGERAAADERLRLMHACHAAFAPVVELVTDSDGDFYDVLERMHYEADDQRAEFRDAEGVLHRFKSCHGPHYAPSVTKALRSAVRTVVAGTAEREAACRYRDAMAARHPDCGPNAPESFVLAALLSSRDPGLGADPARPPLLSGLVIHRIDDDALPPGITL